MKILDELERRKVNTLDLPRDKSQWPVTVTTQELNALIRVARAAEQLMYEGRHSINADALDDIWEALQQLKEVGK